MGFGSKRRTPRLDSFHSYKNASDGRPEGAITVLGCSVSLSPVAHRLIRFAASPSKKPAVIEAQTWVPLPDSWPAASRASPGQPNGGKPAHERHSKPLRGIVVIAWLEPEGFEVVRKVLTGNTLACWASPVVTFFDPHSSPLTLMR